MPPRDPDYLDEKRKKHDWDKLDAKGREYVMSVSKKEISNKAIQRRLSQVNTAGMSARSRLTGKTDQKLKREDEDQYAKKHPRIAKAKGPGEFVKGILHVVSGAEGKEKNRQKRMQEAARRRLAAQGAPKRKIS